MPSPAQMNGRRAGASHPFAAHAEVVLNALSDALMVVGERNEVCYANMAAEQFFSTSADNLRNHLLGEFLPADSPLFSLIAEVREQGFSLSENGVTLDSPRFGERFLTIQISPIIELPGHVVVTLMERTLAQRIDRQLVHRKSTRSLTAMAALLAHEVKNPLSGIRGAAQLLEQTATPADRELTRLICSETDRICDLVDRMDVFSNAHPVERKAVNVHQVLGHVRKIAENGFARSVRFIENYDPSLPPLYGDRDQLVQAFLNLVKNAAEAVPKKSGEIILSTAYKHGVHLAVPGSDSRVYLPLMVSIQDNGKGIPQDLHSCLFDPFVTTKSKGTGLGLALVAKIISDHGGVIEFESRPRRTVFRLRLPIFQEESPIEKEGRAKK